MPTMNHDAPTVNRYAHLTAEEAIELAILDCDHPELGLERDPAEWGPETDERWQTSDHSVADEGWLAEQTAADDAEPEYVLDDDERPRSTWTPSRIVAFEQQEAR